MSLGVSHLKVELMLNDFFFKCKLGKTMVPPDIFCGFSLKQTENAIDLLVVF